MTFPPSTHWHNCNNSMRIDVDYQGRPLEVSKREYRRPIIGTTLSSIPISTPLRSAVPVQPWEMWPPSPPYTQHGATGCKTSAFCRLLSSRHPPLVNSVGTIDIIPHQFQVVGPPKCGCCCKEAKDTGAMDATDEAYGESVRTTWKRWHPTAGIFTTCRSTPPLGVPDGVAGECRPY